MKKVAVLQSNYIPWKGYFDIIHDADLFIFHDDLQYTKHDWRNRNRVKLPDKEIWITVPVHYKNVAQLICDTKIDESQKWQEKHYNTFYQNYRKAPHFREYMNFLHYIYIEKKWSHLHELNQYIVTTISKDYLGIETRFADSRDYTTHGAKHEKLLSLVKAAGADVYISGPAAKNYIIEQEFVDSGIEIVWKDYSGYPEYPQLYGDFCHNVSIMDLLFNTGEDASYYIWGWRDLKNGG